MYTHKSKWDSLSLKDKSEMMRAAVQSGLYSLDAIKQVYNEYAEGGPTDESNNIVDWIIGEEGFNSKPENIGDGKITLGSGLTNSKWHRLYNKKGVWTEEDNRKAVAEEVENRRKWAEQNVPNWSDLPEDSQNALLSYKYNFDFTKNNSPKLFRALEGRNYEEAARQMDATSSNPRFRKGLQARRQREQEMFMRGINSMSAPEPEVAEEALQESIYTPPQRVLDNITANNGRYMIMGNPPLAGTRNTVWDALRRLKALNLFIEGGPLVERANQYTLGGNMYGWGDSLKGSYNSVKDAVSKVSDKAEDALISAANWLHDALKEDSPAPTATATVPVEKDYTSPAFMPYSYGSTFNYNVDDGSWDETKEVRLPEITITTDKVLKELPVEKLSQNEYLRNEYNKDNSVEEARKLNREELKKLQQTLADKGYYDLNTDNMSVDEIKSIQKKIGAKVDGIAGKETKEKWRQYNVDGLWGKRTEEAILKGTKKDYWDRDVTTDNTEWCAEWVHKKAVNATGNDNCGVRGDAWRMPQNVVKSGGTEVYNIYKDKAFRGITDVTSLKKATEKALKEHPFDISTLQVGDIVGIYMPSSDMHSTALRDGTTFNTHVGVVTGFDKNGKPIIEHNIHKNHHKDAADNIRGSLIGKARIATVSRPDYGTPQKAFEVESAPSEYTKESDSPLFKQYAESAAGSKELLQNVFPNVDIDEVERIALAVQGRETGFMKNKRSDQTGISGLKVKAGNYYRDNIIGKNAESVSSNLAKMKLDSFDPHERYMLGLTDPKDLEDPKKAGTAAMYLMAKNYSYFKNLQESYPQLRITDDDIRYLTELSYNQGMSKLRNIGFTSEGAAAPEELEAIRAMADENAKIKDVSATNYRYLGSLGEMLYDAFADGHTPYIAAAEKYRRQLMGNADTE